MNLILLAILGSILFWLGWFIGAIVESNHSHEFLGEEEPPAGVYGYTAYDKISAKENMSTMQEDTLAYAAPDPVVKKRGRPLGSKNKVKETI